MDVLLDLYAQTGVDSHDALLQWLNQNAASEYDLLESVLETLEGSQPARLSLHSEAPALYLYQVKAAEELMRAVSRFEDESDFVQLVLPTGAGKTRVANEFLHNYLNQYPNSRVLWLAPNWTLLEQACFALGALVPDLKSQARRIGGHQQALNHLPENRNGRVYYTTTATLHSRLNSNAFELSFSIVVYDESHWGVNRKMARRIHQHFRALRVSVVGLTATPVSLDSDTSKPRIVYRKSYRELMEKGYLAKPVVFTVETNQVWNPVLTSHNRLFNRNSLNELNNEERNNIIADTLKGILQKRDEAKVLVFACNIQHAEALAHLFGKYNIACASVHSALSYPFEINRMIRQFRNGEVQVLINVLMLTHGFDVPEIDTILLARPSESDVLCSQMVGRGARTTKTKKQFSIYDFHDIIPSHAEKIFTSVDSLFDGCGREPREVGEHHSRDHRASRYPRFEVLLGQEFGDLQGLRYVADQTFGVEIELTLVGNDSLPHFDDPGWKEIADDLLSVLANALGDYRVLLTPHYYHMTPSPEKNAFWHLEYDGSAGWEIISPILMGREGLMEVAEACQALDGFVEGSDIGIDYRTGIHITLATKLETSEQLLGFIKRVRRLEPGLFTLVSPSRLYSFNDGSYDLDNPNDYCKPLRKVDLERIEDRQLEDLADENWLDSGLNVEFDDDEDENEEDEIADERFDRYLTVNLKKWPQGNDYLIEVRMHNGTVDYRKILPWISLWMKIFNVAAYEWKGDDAMSDQVFEHGSSVPGNVDDEDIFALLEREGINISNTLRGLLFNRRKALARRWSTALPRRAQAWKTAGWYESMNYGLDQIRIQTKTPRDCHPEDLEVFVAMVRQGGQVTAQGLEERVNNSHLLAFAKAQDDRIVGVGALKRPHQVYASNVFKDAGLSEESLDTYPIELGWLYIDPDFRHKGAGSAIVAQLLEGRQSKGVFSSVQEDNSWMKEILRKTGFESAGYSFESSITDSTIQLFVKAW